MPGTTWNIDSSHACLDFAVKHMAIATVRGRFKKVSGSVDVGANGAPTSIRASIEAASIDTGDPQRDAHLRSGDFLDVESHPVLTFESTRITPQGPNRYRVDGQLTIRDASRPVAFEVETTQTIKDPWGNVRAGASAVATLNRKDWNVTWNKVLELGALLVGEEVRVTLDVELVAPAVVPA